MIRRLVHIFEICCYTAPLILFTTGICMGQVNREWTARYNGPGNLNDVGLSSAIDKNGNVFVTGASYGANSDLDFVTLKYNSSGAQQWAERYNSPYNGYDVAVSLVTDDLSNVYVAGYTVNPSTSQDFVTIKYNSEGVVQWQRTYDGTAGMEDLPVKIAIDRLGFVYVTGSTTESANSVQIITIKYAPNGDVVWLNKFSNSSGQQPNDIKIDNDLNVYVTGVSGTDFCTFKIKPSGAISWSAFYNGSSNDYDRAVSLSVDGSGNTFVTGYSFVSLSDADFITIKYDLNGAEKWVKQFTRDGEDLPVKILTDTEGNVYVCGISEGFMSGLDYVTVKYSNSGTQLWEMSYNGSGNGHDKVRSMAIDNLSNVSVTGYCVNSSGYGITTIKYTPDGSTGWIDQYYHAGNQAEPFDMSLDASNNIYLTGFDDGASYYDVLTLKYSQPIGIQNLIGEIPANFGLSQNYPNPFNPTTNFEFRVAEFGSVNLTIYDAMGRVVETLQNGEMKPGVYQAQWNAAEYPSGVYFYKLSASGFTETRKMMLIK
ncbi:MAG: SBBP repeat-containing protein [Ignavibacteria bacterium]|nr:SBBP repeat-containing protein [Ignavibacteria bacterium]